MKYETALHMSAFDFFVTQDYTFLQLDSETGGNRVIQEFSANGIVKIREGMQQDVNSEAYTSDSTIHIRPYEPFVELLDANLIGHGIRVTNYAGEPVDYRIIGQVDGFDYELGALDFYRVTVKKEALWQDESELPIE